MYPCATYERGWERLDQYVLEWWGSARGKIASERVAPTPGNPTSMTRDQRIETFFNYWEDKRREFYEIETYEVLARLTPRNRESGSAAVWRIRGERLGVVVALILPDDDDDIPDQYRYDDPARVYATLELALARLREDEPPDAVHVVEVGENQAKCSIRPEDNDEDAEFYRIIALPVGGGIDRHDGNRHPTGAGLC